MTLIQKSLLTQERGLKPYTGKVAAQINGSLLTQERGLKQITLQVVYLNHNVAPHAGAWIETLHRKGCSANKRASLLTQERGLKLLKLHYITLYFFGRSSRRSVD